MYVIQNACVRGKFASLFCITYRMEYYVRYIYMHAGMMQCNVGFGMRQAGSGLLFRICALRTEHIAVLNCLHMHDAPSVEVVK